jgi:hypothetical protein
MLIASKYEEIWAPELRDFIYISDKAYTREQILQMEKTMLNTLSFNLTVPTAYNFLGRLLKVIQTLAVMYVVLLSCTLVAKVCTRIRHVALLLHQRFHFLHIVLYKHGNMLCDGNQDISSPNIYWCQLLV